MASAAVAHLKTRGSSFKITHLHCLKKNGATSWLGPQPRIWVSVPLNELVGLLNSMVTGLQEGASQ